MRSFIAACCITGLIALSAAVILDYLVQQPASTAFTESDVRL
jgi:hypothetical protein